MAHFAKLGAGNKVLAVHVVSNDVATSEQAGIDFLNNLHKDRNVVWKQLLTMVILEKISLALDRDWETFSLVAT